jgi:hypothetical protein
MNSYRNGDWTFIKIGKCEIAKPLNHDGEFTFAEGEATGHFHKIIVSDKRDLILTKTATGDYILSLGSEATITHPEHSMKKDLKIPAGFYRLQQRREKDWFANTVRKVID